MTKKGGMTKKGSKGKKGATSKKAASGKKAAGKKSGTSKKTAGKSSTGAKKKPTTKNKSVARKPAEKKTSHKKSAVKPASDQKAAAKKIVAMRAASKKKAELEKARAAKPAKAAAKSKRVPATSIKIQPVDTSGKAVAGKTTGAGGRTESATSQLGKGLRMRSQPVEVQEIDVRHARRRKDRLAPFFARSYGKTPKKLSAKSFCSTLAKHIGKISTLPKNSLPESVVEIGIFCIFAIGGTQPKLALDATRRSVENFPNWNEFRISDAFEFIEFLDDLQIGDLYDRCEQVLEFVNEVYQDQNKVDLEYLREQPPDDRLNDLNRYQSLGPALAQYLALALQDFEGILFHYSWARVVQRVGIVPRSGSPRILMQSLARVFKGEDLVSLQVNLIQIGEAICQSKNPQCKSCYLVMNCANRKI